MRTRRISETTVAELRSTIAETADRKNAGGVPREVRRRALDLVARQKAAGIAARATAATLGVHEVTLYRWARELRSASRECEGEFREVVLAEDEPRGSLRVAHAASGLVIDGLDVEMLATLLRKLS